MRGKPRNLNDRQLRFVDEYLVDLDASKAAVRAGFSEKGKYTTGFRLLKDTRLATLIHRRMMLRSQRIEVTQDQTIQEIARGCFWDIANMFNEDGSLKEIRDMDYNTRKAIAGFEYVTLYEGEGDQKHAYGRLNKIKLVDRREYLELLGRHQGLFKDELMVKHEFSSELARVVGNGIDLSKFSDEELAEFNANIAKLVGGGRDQRSLPEKPVLLAEEPHKDEG